MAAKSGTLSAAFLRKHLLHELSVQAAAWVRAGSLAPAKVTFLVHKKCRLSSWPVWKLLPRKGHVAPLKYWDLL